MFVISKEVEFDAGHRVPNHHSKCKNPHGHRYRLRVHVAGDLVAEEGNSEEGMVVDFGFLKQLMMEEVHDVFDHGFIVYEHDRVMRAALSAGDEQDWHVIKFPTIPTAENLAKWIWDALESEIERMSDNHLTLHLVELWETPTSLARYSGI